MISRGYRRLALPLILVGALCAADGAGAPAAQAIGVMSGSWSTPKADATVWGTAVQLQFSTSDSTVLFILPYGNQAASVSGGTATGTFDSTRVANGRARLGAYECDSVTGQCDEVDETVTVSNSSAAPAPTPTSAPTFSPAGGSVAPGSTVTVGGSGSAEVIVLIDSVVQDSLIAPLPYSYQVPTGLAVGSHQLELRVDANSVDADGTFTIVVPDTTPPVVSKLRYPASYFPYRDGYLDHFYAIFATNEASTAVLAISRGGRVVSSGTVPVTNSQVVDLRAGDGLKPGSYTWQLIVTDTAGNVTRTPARTLRADARRTVSHTAQMRADAASLSYRNTSGSCSSVKKSGTGIVLASLSRCKSGQDEFFDVASANFTPVLKSAVDYGTVTVRIASRGKGTAICLNLATGKFDVVRTLGNGTATLKLDDRYVGFPRPQILLGIGTAGGNKVTLSSVSITYVYKTLSAR